MAQQKLNTITMNDTEFQGCLLIKSVSFGTAKNGNPFVTITFMDPSGTISAKMWNKGADNFPYESGQVVSVDAKIDFYRNEAQLVVTNMLALPADDPRNRISYYLQAAPMPLTKMRKVIENVLEGIKNPLYKDIAETFLAKTPNGNSFEEQPAAKVIHHPYYRGLMYHTVRMTQQAKGLLSVYTDMELNEDLLFTAILIHDLGKLEELTGFMDTEYTTYGTLVSHIAIVDGWIVEYAIEKGLSIHDEDIVLLRHMVLSHHGRLEYGSPTMPHIPEAEMLHRIDDTDARLTMFETELKNTQEGELSKRIFGLDNRTIYKTPSRKDELNA